MNREFLNGSGCKDMTAYDAIKNIEREERQKQAEEDRLRKLVMTIFDVCDLAGFHVEGRIILKDKRTGKIWR